MRPDEQRGDFPGHREIANDIETLDGSPQILG